MLTRDPLKFKKLLTSKEQDTASIFIKAIPHKDRVLTRRRSNYNLFTIRIMQFFRKMFNWELWPFYVLYTPIGPVWFWYCLKARSFWFFSTSNPTITFGGFE